MENKCRSCLTLSPRVQYYSLLTVFPEFTRKSLSVLDLLSLVTSSQVDLSNNLPSKICSGCFQSLKYAYSFIVSFQHSQKLLLENSKETENLGTQESENENQEEFYEKEEKIIIITGDENESNVDSECVKMESSEAEDTISEATSVDLSEDEIIVKDEIDWFDYEDVPMSQEEKKENGEIFDDEVDQEIIQMEETIVQQTKPKLNNPKPDNITTPKLFNCEFCENKYTAHKYLLVHIKSKHPKDLVDYQTKLKQTKAKNELEIYKCEICDKVFISKSNLTSHNYTFHHPEWNKMYSCNLCDKVFQSKNAARYHKLAKHEGKHFTCNICDKKFITSSTLKQHITGVHEKIRPENYLCSICGRGFTNTTALKYHMGKVHTNKRDFVCSYCGAAFILVAELRCHERNHTGERPFSCKYCKKTFKRSTEKQRHEKTHLGIYPYKCEYCKVRVFTSKYNMQVHWLQHRGQCECEECGKGFASEDILKFHLTHRHKVKFETNIE